MTYYCDYDEFSIIECWLMTDKLYYHKTKQIHTEHVTWHC